MKKKIAIIYGGYSAEAEVSKKSAGTLYKNIDTNLFEPYLVEITAKSWYVHIRGGVASIDKNKFTYILNDEEWKAEYNKNVNEFSEQHFTSEKMNKIYSNYRQLLTNYVIGEQGEITNYTFLESGSDFTDAIDFLKQHVIERKTAVQEFLNK